MMSALPPKADIVCDKVRIMKPVTIVSVSARRHVICVARHLRLTTLLVPVPSPTCCNMCRATAAMIRASSSA